MHCLYALVCRPLLRVARLVTYLIVASAILPAQNAWALTQTRTTTSCASGTYFLGFIWFGDSNWSTTGNVAASDNQYATVSLGSGNNSSYLRCTTLGFSIPAGAAINGITAKIERKANNANAIRDSVLKLVKGGQLAGSDKANTSTYYGTTDANATYGSAIDLWGTTWAATDINASNFGIALRLTAAGGAGTGSIDYVEITVDYTPAAACTNPNTSTISYVAATGPTNDGNVSSLSFNFPSGTAVNDVMLAQVTSYVTGSSACRTVTTPSGWTQVRLPDTKSVKNSWFSSNSSCISQSLFWKAATATSGTVTFPLSGSAYATGQLISYRGAVAASPILSNTGQGNSSSGTISSPAVSSIIAGNLIVGFFGTGQGTSTMTAPISPCLTERRDANTNSSPGVTVSVADGAAGTGSSGTISASATNAALNVGQAVVLQAVPVPLSPSRFNAFDTSTTVASPWTGNITTKQAGVGFSLKLIALNSALSALNTAASTVTITLVANNVTGGSVDSKNCPTSGTTIPGITVGTTIPASAAATIAIPAVANSWPDVRVKIVDTSTSTTACSNDNFAIRPASFGPVAALDADWKSAWISGASRTLANTAASGGNVHAAGQAFTLRASALNGAASPAVTTQYTGIPKIDVTACPLPAGCAIDGSGSYAAGAFDPGTWSSSAGVPTSTTATYTEAGAITLSLVDETFASVDAADGTPATCAGRYICSASGSSIGRFVPDHFDVSLNDSSGTAYPAPSFATFGNSCASRSFTYIGQPFTYAVAAQALAEALDANGNIVANYQGFAGTTPNATVTQTYTAMPASPVLDTSAAGTPTLTLDTDGAALIAVASGAGKTLSFTRGGTPVVPFNADISLALSVSDTSESATSGNGSITTTNPANFTSIAFDAGTEFRYGRLQMSNAFGAEVLPLTVPTITQYYAAGGWASNSADNCTTIAVPASGSGLSINLLSSGSSSASMANGAASGSVTTGNGTFYAGNGRLILTAPGRGKTGNVDITLAAPTWLTFSGIPNNKTARASFGLNNQAGNANRIIERREVR